MSERRRAGLIFALLAALSLIVTATAIVALHRADVERRLAELQNATRLAVDLPVLALLPPSSPETAAVPPPPLKGTDAILRHLGADGRLRLIDGRTPTVLIHPLPISTDAALAAAPAGIRSPSPDYLELLRSLAGRNTLGAEAEDEEGVVRLVAVHALPQAAGLAVIAETEAASVRDQLILQAAVLSGCAVLLLIVSALALRLVFKPLVQRAKAGERRYGRLLDSLHGGAVVCRSSADSDEFIITRINPSGARMDNVEPTEVIGRSIGEGLPWTRQTRLVEMMKRVWRTGVAEHLPETAFGDESASGWREAFLYKASPEEIVVLYDDVSDRKRSIEALKDSEARWRSIIEIQTAPVVIVDDNQDIRYVNRAAEILFGKSENDLVGAPFGFPISGKDVAEIEILKPGRGLSYAEMRAVPIRDSGRENHLLLLQDVSAHKRAEGDLRKLFQAIEQSPSSVMITDIHGRIEYVNPKFTEVSGYTYPEVVGKSPSILKSQTATTADYKQLWQTISSGEVWRGEFHNRKKSGELYWEHAAIAPVRDPSGRITHYVAVKEDITERKITEEQLRVSQRLELIGQLTGGIAHDFNNLLGIIVGNLQLLEEKPGLDRESRELIADAIWSAQRGAQLTHRLLAFARQQRLYPKVLDLNNVVAEMTELLRRTLGERIEIRETLAPGLWMTKIDRSQLESALLNLIVNARDAMPQGGLLTVTTANVVLPCNEEPGLKEAAPGNYVSLTVTDNGTGMPPDILERIFEPFFTTKKVGEGSGLGLSMVYGFVRQSGGYVVVDSTVGRGTSVKLFVPQAAPEDGVDRGRARPRGRSRTGETIGIAGGTGFRQQVGET